MLEHKLTVGECTFASNDQAALLQLLSQAEKFDLMADEQNNELQKNRQSVLEKRLKAGPLASNHLAVLKLLGQAEVGEASGLTTLWSVHWPANSNILCRVLSLIQVTQSKQSSGGQTVCMQWCNSRTFSVK
jgi:hypothetical protein